MQKYNHSKIEKKWQKYWETKKVFVARDFSKKPKKFVLVEFPYPSGAGLHMGHLRPYVAADVYARYHRMRGYEVLFPMGWDAFGLPAENYALKMGVHPSKTTAENIKNAKKQIQSWGLSFDWSREINTTDPSYYKWTQWLFLQFYKKGLAYEATGLINWCPKDKTGLANEEVIDGKCERCGMVVEKKELRQWYLKITAYAEKLLQGLKNLSEWPEAVKTQQENWIGKKTGINIIYEIEQKNNFVLLHGFKGSSEGIFFPWLKTEFDKRNIKYQAPNLPNPENPTEEEQVKFVLKNCKFDENTILFGHSLGSVIALKVLEKLNIKISGLMTAGGFVSHKFKDRPRPFDKSFSWKFDFEKIKSNVNKITVLQDLNDYAVSDDQATQLSEALNVPITRQAGAKPHFAGLKEPVILENLLPTVTCFTTRPDTNFGATFIVLGPEHKLLKDRNILNIEEKIWQEIEKYKAKTASEDDAERTNESRKKTGVFTGLYCINTLNSSRMPLYVADYVLGNVGTGAVVGVPGHDKRDFEFAQVFNIPVVRVIQKSLDDNQPIITIDQVQEDMGIMVNSDFLNGMDIHSATGKIMDYMEEKGSGKRVVNYKLRDWVFSRQRYWGEPIPLLHCENCGIVPVPEKDLPVVLPKVKKYEPTGTGESPLAVIEKWINVICHKCGGKARRETNTMPQWAGSSWYWLRYTDPKNKKQFADIKKQKYWTPVDVYFGGMEHTTLHLLYSRFWNLFMADDKLVTQNEPYQKRVPHGIILGPDGEKMSKSRGNVVNPDTIVKSDGADTLRMYELFLGPHEASVSWNERGHVGVKRFLDRIWNWVNVIVEAGLKPVQSKGVSQALSCGADSEVAKKALHRLIKKIGEDIQNFNFNTCISAFMEFHNQVKDEMVSLETVKTFLILLYPFAPHVAEELNQQVGKLENRKIGSLQFQAWPVFDPKLIVDNTVEIVIQVNGRVKGKMSLATGSSRETAEVEAKKLEPVKQALVNESIKRIVFVPNRLINFVV